MMRRTLVVALVISAVAATANAEDLCKLNPYTPSEASRGKVLFDSHCALCHQYSMAGRVPGNFRNETPDINILSASDLEFLDHGGGRVPPLLGDKFFRKEQSKSIAEFSAFVSSAAVSFPPTAKLEVPLTYFQIAAYVLYRNCGKVVTAPAAS